MIKFLLNNPKDLIGVSIFCIVFGAFAFLVLFDNKERRICEKNSDISEIWRAFRTSIVILFIGNTCVFLNLLLNYF